MEGNNVKEKAQPVFEEPQQMVEETVEEEAQPTEEPYASEEELSTVGDVPQSSEVESEPVQEDLFGSD